MGLIQRTAADHPEGCEISSQTHHGRKEIVYVGDHTEQPQDQECWVESDPQSSSCDFEEGHTDLPVCSVTFPGGTGKHVY